MILDDIFEGIQIEQTLRKLGPDWTRRSFSAYLRASVEFKAEWDQAQIDSCEFIENDLLNVDKRFDGKQGSHKMASIWSTNRLKILEARNPEKYGKKLELTVPVSIRGNIEKANERIRQITRDVTTSAIAEAVKKASRD